MKHANPRRSKRIFKRGRRQTRAAFRRAHRRPRWGGAISIKRTSNVYGMAGIVVDGTVCAKANQNVVVNASGTFNAITWGTLTCNFKLEDCVNYTEFTNLYDQYKIVGVKLKLIPYQTDATTAAAPSSLAGQPSFLIHSVIDYDDNTAVSASNTGADAMRQYPSYRCSNIYARHGKPWSRYLRPKIAREVYRTPVLTGYESAKMPWLDSDYADVSAYGLKLLFEVVSGGAAAQLMFKAEVTYYLRFKNPH